MCTPESAFGTIPNPALEQVFGSSPPRNHRVWQAWRRENYQLTLFERTHANAEQGVDSSLIADMQRSMLRFRVSDHTLVLLTGDGNGNGGHASFLEAVHHTLTETNWKVLAHRNPSEKHELRGPFLSASPPLACTFLQVEVWSWRATCSGHYRRMQENYGSTGRFQLKFLDIYRDTICFRAGGFTLPAPGAELQPAQEPAALEEGADDEDVFICPIDRDILRDPVRTIYTPHHYERAAITGWISRSHSCPMSRQPLDVGDLQAPDPEFLPRLASYWERTLDSMPQADREHEERSLPAFVVSYRADLAAAGMVWQVLASPGCNKSIIPLVPFWTGCAACLHSGPVG